MLDKCAYIAQLASEDNLCSVNEKSAAVLPKRSFYADHCKRALDLLVSVPAFMVLLPVNTALGVITYFDVGKPIFFRQLRTGKDGKPFYLVKFRNMTEEKDAYGNLLPPSERVTKFGKFVRKYSLDELLNFWSIVKGDMSLIGPRPLPVEFEERYSNRHRMRSAVRPGLECPSLKTDGHVRLYQEQFENDIWYVENISFAVDVKMVMALFKMVFNKGERGDHAAVGGGNFVGYDKNGVAFSMRRIPEEYEHAYSEYVKQFSQEEELSHA